MYNTQRNAEGMEDSGMEFFPCFSQEMFSAPDAALKNVYNQTGKVDGTTSYHLGDELNPDWEISTDLGGVLNVFPDDLDELLGSPSYVDSPSSNDSCGEDFLLDPRISISDDIIRGQEYETRDDMESDNSFNINTPEASTSYEQQVLIPAMNEINDDLLEFQEDSISAIGSVNSFHIDTPDGSSTESCGETLIPADIDVNFDELLDVEQSLASIKSETDVRSPFVPDTSEESVASPPPARRRRGRAKADSYVSKEERKRQQNAEAARKYRQKKQEEQRHIREAREKVELRVKKTRKELKKKLTKRNLMLTLIYEAYMAENSAWKKDGKKIVFPPWIESLVQKKVEESSDSE